MAAFLILVASLPQQEVSVQAEYAFGGRYRPCFWAPVRISIDNPGKFVEGAIQLRWAWPGANLTGAAKRIVDIGEGEGPIYEIPVALPERSRRVYTAYVRAPEGMSLWVGFDSREARLSRPVEVYALPAKFHRPFVAVVGKSVPAGLRDAGRGRIETAVTPPESLPDRWIGYSSVDAVVWTGGDAGELRDPRQGKALRQWIAVGGHLVLARSHLTGIEGTELEELLPLESAAPLAAEVPPGLGAPRGEVSLLHGRLRPGARALIPGAVFRWNHGRGRVTLVAFDPSSEPFRSWEGMRLVWDRVLEPRSTPDDREDPWAAVDSLGANLGSASLARFAFWFPEVETPSLAWLFWIILVYAILVGPVDYWVLRRLRRQELTWVTFPACVIGFLALTAASAGTSARRLAAACEVAVLDVIPEARIGRTFAIGSVLTPSAESVAFDSTGAEDAIVPLASGSRQFGGDRKTMDRMRIVQSNRIHPSEVRVARGATTVSILERIETSPLKISFEVDGGKLVVQNDTGAILQDAWLLTPDGAMEVGELPPGRVERGDLRPGLFPGESVSPEELGGLGSLTATHGETRDPFDLAGMKFSIRRLLLGLTFSSRQAPPAFLTGPARAMEVRPWLEDGGMALVGWMQRDPWIRYRGLEPDGWGLVLVRVFAK